MSEMSMSAFRRFIRGMGKRDGSTLMMQNQMHGWRVLSAAMQTNGNRSYSSSPLSCGAATLITTMKRSPSLTTGRIPGLKM